jgi:RNA polymerase sigma factor (sigma-70 family)
MADMRTPTMHELVDRLQAGDQHAQTELFRRTEKHFNQIARRMLWRFPVVRAMERPSDVLQMAVVKLFKHLEKCRPDNTKHYINTAGKIIRQHLMDLDRRYKGTRKYLFGLLRYLPPIPDESGADLLLGYPAPEEDMTFFTWLHEAAERLLEKERKVFKLKFYNGLTFKEIAETFEKSDVPLPSSDSTVKRLWWSACLLLREMYQHDYPQS